MISDIPSADDFLQASMDLLNLAWDATVELYLDRAQSGGTLSPDADPGDHYWRSAQPILTSSFTLIVQAIEFFLKGRICSVSPYLLLSGQSGGWPKNADQVDTSFSDYRSVDAQDLVRIHNSVCLPRLPAKFTNWYDMKRRERNRAMHTVGGSNTLLDKDVIVAVLEASEHILGRQSWVDARLGYLRRTPSERIREAWAPSEVANPETWIAYQLGAAQREIMSVIKYLDVGQGIRFFGFDTRKPCLICPRCLSLRGNEFFFELKDLEQDLYLRTLQERPEDPPNTASCIFCKSSVSTIHKMCPQCGDAIAEAHTGICLDCIDSLDCETDESMYGSHSTGTNRKG